MDARRTQEYLACLALRHSPGLGPRTWKKILSAYPSAGQAVADAVQWPGKKLATAGQVREFQSGAWRAKADHEAEAALARNMHALLWFDPGYPEILRQIPGPPVCLYLLGDATLLQSPCLAVVGSRRCSRYGLEAARKIGKEVSRAGVCIVSGFASGIDRQAHLAALEEVGSSIAVLGTGLDLVYPAANRDLWLLLRDRGLIVTEFPPGTRPDARNFPHRNRIISGLSLGVLVIEAAVRSGSLITATSALEQGREVFALPGPVNLESYEGCHHLIRQGAMLVQSAEDILAELRPQLAPSGADSPSEPPKLAGTGPLRPGQRWPDLAGDDLLLAEALHGRERVHIDALCQVLGREAGEISRRLLVLEMRAIVSQLPGMYYQLQ
ncbi:MAG TPA: DNA-protecting protein DprA [Desulfonatronum sp.]|nr:DNA-protecting protein DprA [Desulfonatronum sp.]